MTPPPIASITLFSLPLPSAGDDGARPLRRLRAPSPTQSPRHFHKITPHPLLRRTGSSQPFATHACLQDLRCTVGASEIPIAPADRGAHSPAVSFTGGFRTPARQPSCVLRAQRWGRHPKPVTEPDLTCGQLRQMSLFHGTRPCRTNATDIAPPHPMSGTLMAQSGEEPRPPKLLACATPLQRLYLRCKGCFARPGEVGVKNVEAQAHRAINYDSCFGCIRSSWYTA